MKNLIHWQTYLFPFLIACCLMTVASYCFALPYQSILLLSGFLLIPFTYLFFRLLQQQKNKRKLKDFLLLLEFLSIQTVAGATLEIALMKAAPHFLDQLGSKNKLQVALQTLHLNLSSKLPLNSALSQFRDDFNCLEANYVINLLAPLFEQGAALHIFIKNIYDFLTAEKTMRENILAEQNERYIEALLLCTLPFLSALFLSSNQEYSHYFNLFPQKNILLFILCLVSLLSLMLLFFFSLTNRQPKNKIPLFLLSQTKLTRVPAKYLIAFFSKHPLFSYFPSICSILTFIFSRSPKIVLGYIQKKLELFFLSLLLLCMVGLTQTFQPYHLVFLLLPCCQDLLLLSAYKQLKLDYLIEVVPFIQLMTLLLRSGLSLEKALSFCFLIQPTPRKKYQSLLKKDLKTLNLNLTAGKAAVSVLSEWLAFRPFTIISPSIHLLIQYGREGYPEILNLLQIHATNDWQLYQNSLRKKLGQRNLKLLLPMSLSLITIIFTCLFPALAALNQF